MKVIGLGHYSRTGKDSFANYYLAELGTRRKAKKISFAWKLKQITHELYAWDGMREPEFYETAAGTTYRDIPLPTIGKTPVQLWIDLGTPAVRNCVYQNTWIDYVLRSDHDCDVMAVTDVRFENEVESVKNMGGILIKVVRPGYGPRKSPADRALLGWTGWDFVIGASGEMEELRDWAVKFAKWTSDEGPRPYQSEADKLAALGVEKIEPWENQPTVENAEFFTLDKILAKAILEMEGACFSEGLGPVSVEGRAAARKLLNKIRASFPAEAEPFSYLFHEAA